MCNTSMIAVPTGVSSLDENSIRYKVRTKAKNDMKSKPIGFGTSFYVVVGWGHWYLHHIIDNTSGNTSGLPAAQQYTSLFRQLCAAVDRKGD